MMSDFRTWRAKVNMIAEGMIELSLEDLIDVDYWGMWDDNLSPREAAERVFEENDIPMEGWNGQS